MLILSTTHTNAYRRCLQQSSELMALRLPRQTLVKQCTHSSRRMQSRRDNVQEMCIKTSPKHVCRCEHTVGSTCKDRASWHGLHIPVPPCDHMLANSPVQWGRRSFFQVTVALTVILTLRMLNLVQRCRFAWFHYRRYWHSKIASRHH